MSTDQQPRPEASGSDPGEPTEEELRAAYEAQVKQLRVEHVMLENVVTLANLGMRRTGLAPGTEDERDAGQVRLAIESIRALLPLLEQTAPNQVAAIRDALSQLQLAFIRIGGQETPASGGEGPAGGGPAGGGTSGEGPAGGTQGGGTQGGGTQGGGTPRGGGPAGRTPKPDEPPAAKPGEPGPAERSGRLWVPGQ